MVFGCIQSCQHAVVTALQNSGAWRLNDLNEMMIIMVTVDLLGGVTSVLKWESSSMMDVKEDSRLIYFRHCFSLPFPLSVVLPREIMSLVQL